MKYYGVFAWRSHRPNQLTSMRGRLKQTTNFGEIERGINNSAELVYIKLICLRMRVQCYEIFPPNKTQQRKIAISVYSSDGMHGATKQNQIALWGQIDNLFFSISSFAIHLRASCTQCNCAPLSTLYKFLWIQKQWKVDKSNPLHVWGWVRETHEKMRIPKIGWNELRQFELKWILP